MQAREGSVSSTGPVRGTTRWVRWKAEIVADNLDEPRDTQRDGGTKLGGAETTGAHESVAEGFEGNCGPELADTVGGVFSQLLAETGVTACTAKRGAKGSTDVTNGVSSLPLLLSFAERTGFGEGDRNVTAAVTDVSEGCGGAGAGTVAGARTGAGTIGSVLGTNSDVRFSRGSVLGTPRLGISTGAVPSGFRFSGGTGLGRDSIHRVPAVTALCNNSVSPFCGGSLNKHSHLWFSGGSVAGNVLNTGMSEADLLGNGSFLRYFGESVPALDADNRTSGPAVLGNASHFRLSGATVLSSERGGGGRRGGGGGGGGGGRRGGGGGGGKGRGGADDNVVCAAADREVTTGISSKPV